jgi:hypothetical protein
MGNTSVIKKCNFEDIQDNIPSFKNNEYLLINTLGLNEQNCLIPNTISFNQEEEIINNIMKTNISIKIFIYGKNMNDDTIYKKYNQLTSLGFINIFLYTGGLFEWLCLQDIYGDDLFPTTSKELDILKFKALSYKKNILLLNN